MQDIVNIISLIEKSIKEDGENLITSGNIIKDWFNEEIDKIYKGRWWKSYNFWKYYQRLI